jgi:phage-related protein
VIVGSAEVELVASDARLDGSVRDTLRSTEGTFAAAGRSSGDAFGEGFAVESKTIGQDAAGRLRDDRGRFVAAGREVGQGFGDAAGREAAQQTADTAREGGGRIRGVFGAIGRSAGLAFAAAAGAVGAVSFFKSAIDAASDVGESTSKVSVVFGKAADDVLRFAENSATGFGQSRAQALEATGTFGNLLRSVGLAEKQSATFSTTMVGLASDLASFNNTTTDEALEALRSGLIGETEPLKRFGVNLNAARIEEEALRRGLAKGKDDLTDSAKAQAAYALILKDTKLAQGDFARTSGGLANQQRILSAQWANAKAQMGQNFLPAATAVVTTLNQRLLPALSGVRDGIAPFTARLGAGARELGSTVAPAVGKVRNAIVAAFSAGGGSENSGGRGPLAPLVDGARDLASNVLPHLDGLRDTLGGFISGLMPTLAGLGNQLVNTLGPGMSAIGEIIGGQVIPAFRAFLPAVLPIAKFLLETIGGALIGALQGALNIIQGVLKIIAGVMNVFAGILTGDWDRAWKGVKQIFSGAFKALLGAVQVFLNVGILKAFRLGLTLLKSIFTGGLRLITSAWSGALSGLGSLARGALRGIGSLISGAIRGYIGLWRTGLTALRNIAASLLARYVALWRSVLTRIVGVLRGAGSALVSAGRNLVQGLIDGASQLLPKIGEFFLSKLPSWIRGPFERAMGISSPSRLFRRYGFDITAGLASGLDAGGKTAQSAAVRLAEGVARRFTAAQDRLKAAITARVDYYRQIRDAAVQVGGSITDLEKPTAGSIVGALRRQLAEVTGFKNAMRELIRRGLNQATIRQLAEAGVEQGGASARALLAGGQGAVRAVNALQRRLAVQAGQLGTAVSRDLYQAGVNTARGLVAGIASQRRALINVAGDMGKKIAAAVRKALGIRSPSTVMAAIGANATTSLADSLTAGIPRITEASDRVGRAVRPDLSQLTALAAQQARAQLAALPPAATGGWAAVSRTINVDARGMDRSEALAMMRSKEQLDEILYGQEAVI